MNWLERRTPCNICYSSVGYFEFKCMFDVFDAFIYLRWHIYIHHAYLLIMSRVIVFIVLPMANYKEKDTSNLWKL